MSYAGWVHDAYSWPTIVLAVVSLAPVLSWAQPPDGTDEEASHGRPIPRLPVVADTPPEVATKAADSLSTERLYYLTHYRDEIDGLYGAKSIAISRDGRWLYVAGRGCQAILAFRRNPTDGALTLAWTYQSRWSDDKLPSAIILPDLSGPAYLVISPDDRHLYVMGHQPLVLQRDAATGALEQSARIDDAIPHKGIKSPWLLELSPDGKHAYAISGGGNTLIAFSRNAKSGALRLAVVYQGEDFVNPREETEDATTVRMLQSLRAIRVSPDGAHVYATGGLGVLHVFRRDTDTGHLYLVATHAYRTGQGQRNTDYAGLPGAIDMMFSSDGTNLYIASHLGRLSTFVRDADTGELHPQDILMDNRNGVEGLGYATSVAVAPDGNSVYAYGERKRTIAVFQRTTDEGRLRFVHCVRDEVDEVDGLCDVRQMLVSPDNAHLYTISAAQAITAFSRTKPTGVAIASTSPKTPTPKERQKNDATPAYRFRRVLRKVFQAERPVVAGTFSHDDRYLYAAAMDGNVHVWDATSGEAVSKRTILENCQVAAFSPDGRLLAASQWVGDPISVCQACIWNTSDWSLRHRFDHSNGIDSVDFSSDSKRLAAGASDRTVRIWDTETGERICLLDKHRGRGGAATGRVKLSPNGNKLAHFCGGTLKLVDLTEGKEQLILKTASFPCPMEFSPDGSTLLMSNERVRSIDLTSGTIRYSFDPGTGNLELSPGGEIVLLTTMKTLQVRTVASGKLLHEIPFDGPHECFAFSHDGKRFAVWALSYPRKETVLTVWEMEPADDDSSVVGG